MSISTPRYDDQDIISEPGVASCGGTFFRILVRNPAIAAASCMGLGVLVGTYVAKNHASEYLWILVAAGCFGTILALARRSLVWTWFGIGSVFFVLGMHASVQEWRGGGDFEPQGDYASIEANIVSMLSSGPGFRTFLLESGQYGPERVVLPGYGRMVIRQEDLSCKAGDRIAFNGRIRKPKNRGNPGEFNWELDCRNNGIYWLASVRPKTPVIVASRAPRYYPYAILFNIRDKMNHFLDSASGRFVPSGDQEDVKAILKGIVIGDLGEVSPRLYRTFSDSGLVHALSASGVHIAMVALLATCLVKGISWIFPSMLLWFPFNKIAACASIPAMIFYCVIVGGRVPAIRATIMGIMIATAIVLERKWHSANSLAFAAIIVLFLYPLSLFTPSFLLSFSAVAGIVVVLGSFRSTPDKDLSGASGVRIRQGQLTAAEKAKRLVSWVYRESRVVLLVSLGAVIAMAPIIWYFFRAFPVYTLLANLATDCVMTGALGLGLLACVFSLVSQSVGAFLLVPADFCAFLVVKISDIFSGLPWSVFRRAHPDIIQLVLLTLFAVSVLLVIGKVCKERFKPLLLVMCFSGVLLVGMDFIRPNEQNLVVYFLNVGKGDSIFVRSPGSKGIIVDGGVATEYFDAGRSIVLPFLYWAGVTNLGGIVLTHPDMDHIGGLATLVDSVGTENIWWNPVATSSPHLEKIFMTATRKKVPIVPVTRETAGLQFGDASLKFMNPPAGGDEHQHGKVKMNDTSVVFRLDYGETSFLFTGDLEHEGEEELLRSRMPLRADVLKIAHHGGKTSTSAIFLKAVAPKIAIISADYPKVGGLPNEDILERLASFGIQVYWTGRDGAVTVLSDGRSLTVNQGRLFR